MSKPAIDELLDTVSGCDMDDPRFGSRYGGDMSDEEFLLEVDDYILGLQREIDKLRKALAEAIGA